MQNRVDTVFRILVCGAGSIGLRHVNNLKSCGVEVYVWRNRSELAKDLMDELNVKVYTSLDDALDISDAVVIATATNTHLDIALKAAKRGKAIFIEKPISLSISGIREFSELVREKKLIVEIGCQLRTHQNLKKLYELTESGKYGPLYTFRVVVGQRLDVWRPGTDYRHCYSSDIKQGGGALLDLIHEIDLVLWFAGPITSVKAHLANVSDQEIDAEDLVNLILVNSNGAVGQVQMDMLSPDYRRGLELIYRDAIFYWDYVTGILECRSKGKVGIVDQVPNHFERNLLFIKHMNHFLDRLSQPNKDPLCSLEDGIAAQCVVEAARLSNARDTSVSLRDIPL